jgi:hypothetical protein
MHRVAWSTSPISLSRSCNGLLRRTAFHTYPLLTGSIPTVPGGQNAYITAIDPGSREILWRSRSLVSNSENFIIAGDTIVTGYGFSAESDYISLLNRLTGEVMEIYSVPSAPVYL